MPRRVGQIQIGGFQLLGRVAEGGLELINGGFIQRKAAKGVAFPVHVQRVGGDVELITHLQRGAHLPVLVDAYGFERHAAGGQLDGGAVIDRAFLCGGGAIDGVVIHIMAFDLRLLGLGQPRLLGFAQVSGTEADLAQGFVGIGRQIAFGRGRRGIIEGVGHADRIADQISADRHCAQRDCALFGNDAAILAENAVLRQHRVVVHGVVHVVALR